VRRLSFGLLWLFIFSIPLESTTSIPSIGTGTRLLGIVATVVGAIVIAARGHLRKLELVHVLAILFVVWACASLFWSIDAEATERRLWTYTQLLLMVLVIWNLAEDETRSTRLLCAYVFGGVAASLATIGNYVSGNATAIYEERYAATGFDPNELGVMLAIGIPLAWFVVTKSPRPTGGWIGWIYIPLSMFAVVLTASRTALICAGVATSVVIWGRAKLRPFPRAIAVCLAITVPVVAWRAIPEASLVRLGTIGSEMGDLNRRVEIWVSGFRIFLENPAVGVGSGAFQTAIAAATGTAHAAHNSFLAVAVELGLAGLLLFGGIVLVLLIATRNVPRTESWIWILVLLTWALGASTLSWDYRKITWLIFAFLTARATLPVGRAPDERRSPTDLRLP
jgi:O-antigen ligase